MSEAPVNIVKLAVGVKSVEELALIQRRFLSQGGTDANNGFYHSTKLMPKKHEAIVKSGSLYWVLDLDLASWSRTKSRAGPGPGPGRGRGSSPGPGPSTLQ